MLRIRKVTWSTEGMPFATQGFSSGYSSAEEHYKKSIKSNPSSGQSVTEPQFVVWDVFHSPAQALVMFYWWLGSSWYSLSSRLSLINVFLLSRCTSDMRKSVVLVLLLIFLIFGIWYWFPFASRSPPHEVVFKTPSVKHTDRPVKETFDHLQHATLSNLKEEIVSLHEREATLMKDIELLKMESMRQKVKSEMMQTDLKSVNDQMRNAESEHEQQISNLKSSISNLQSTQDLLKERVDAQDTLNTNLRAELSDWLIKLLKDPSSLESTIVLRPELQRALEDLEKRILDKLVHEKESRRDEWRTVGETLQQEGAGAVTIQPELYPGKCWAFRGSQGFLVIALSYPVRITHVTLEHLPKELSPTGRIDSAPKDFAVYGMSDETEDGKLLGTFMYDQDGEPIQSFKLADASEIYSMTELRILSNWGHLEYTCVYRFRVHGEPSFV
ncbi:hypothetical protein cypCar_00016033 [Cyprinus carpio]|nr:hypothetical protein cypCar_00016033 [Cyprinus carpio]